MTLRETIVSGGQTLYAPVLACRPVRIEDYSTERLQLYRRIIAEAGVEPTIYPGSTYQPCEDCGIEVAVGPRGQAAIDLAHEVGLLAHVCCLIDAAQRTAQMRAEADEVAVINMGNPFKKA